MRKTQKPAAPLPEPKPVQYFYSPSTRGFFTSDIHGDKIPRDAAEITREQWQELLDKQGAGHEIVPGRDGAPKAVPRVKTTEHHRSDLLAARDTALAKTQDLVERHRDEVDMGRGTTLTDQQYIDLLMHRHALRRLHEHPDYQHDEAVAKMKVPSPPDFAR